MQPIKRALISVSDKSGAVELALSLAAQGVEILATGGTRTHLSEAGIAVTEVANYTGSPELLGGRVKTLHPKIHAGILARRSGPQAAADQAQLQEAGIGLIDLVVINLYPFVRTIADPQVCFAEAIEQIDIGGVALLRAAAKNHDSVTVVVDTKDYTEIREALKQPARTLDAAARRRLAAKAFGHAASYDGAIANYLGGVDEAPAAGRGGLAPAAAGRGGLAPYLNMQLQRLQPLRYGENPHQQAALYADAGADAATGLAAAQQLQGKPLSYNNFNDAETAWQCALSFKAPSCVIVKHANPCGVASAADAGRAYQLALQTDPTSAFGGIIAFNCPIDAELLVMIAEGQFAEVIIAPEVTGDYATALAKRKNVRLLICAPPQAGQRQGMRHLEVRSVTGGLLVQEADVALFDVDDLQVVSERAPTDAERASLLFAWTVAKFVKSNAMVLASGRQTIGIGAGQMSRVYSTRIAAMKARDEGLETAGTVLASDAFLPFRDGLDEAAAIGVKALIQPGGSVRDAEVIAAANEADVAMIFTGMRHFRH